MSYGYTNLTVEEAWDLLTDTANGIQIPIDVRTNNEWNDVRMDTPVPENPRHYCLAWLQNETMLHQFMTLYDGLEVIIYCAAGYRSFIATNLLIDNEFTGTIYNMPGGMSGWLDAALPTISGGHTNITVEEALELFTNTNNGIQIPIDVRTDGEWVDEHIDTQPPENPKHHPDLHHSNETQLQEFNELYNGREIVLYCRSGYRSFVATNLLIDNEFNGTIYNMLGGINAWKAAGYPIIGDQPPSVEIINPREGYFHFSGIPLLPTPFDLIADTLSLGGFRSRPVIINVADDFDNREDLIVKVYLNGEEQGDASFCCEWKLHEWFWTGWALGNFLLNVTAKDTYGSIGSTQIDIWNFCIFP